MNASFALSLNSRGTGLFGTSLLFDHRNWEIDVWSDRNHSLPVSLFHSMLTLISSPKYHFLFALEIKNDYHYVSGFTSHYPCSSTMQSVCFPRTMRYILHTVSHSYWRIPLTCIFHPIAVANSISPSHYPVRMNEWSLFPKERTKSQEFLDSTILLDAAAPKIALQGCFRSSPFARCSLLSPLDKLETKMATVSVTW